MFKNLDALCLLPNALVANLREALLLRWTYHSNAIEGNTLTLKETKVVPSSTTLLANPYVNILK